MRVELSGGALKTHYFHKDHLGSISVITNETGVVLERLGFDAWGKRRYANGTDDIVGAIQSETSRGFTGHEELDAVGLVHMNGRIYDPVIARFMSADPVTESPFSTQGWNRYSYVGNSPLNFTDPSGYCFAGCFWKGAFKAIQQALIRVPLLRTLLTIAAAIVCQTCAPVVAALVAGLTSAAITGITGGNLSQSLRAGLIAATSVLAFTAVGNWTAMPDGSHNLPFGSPNHLANIAGHAAVGCAVAVASGGKCGSGAAGAAAGAFGSPLLVGQGLVAGTLMSAGLGGLASVASGGKFLSGAETAAFGYLFNAMAESANEEMRRRIAQGATDKWDQTDWAQDATRGRYGPGTNKCNVFIYDVLEGIGLIPPSRGWPTSGGPITAGTWADPSSNISGWSVVQNPQPGDIGASSDWRGLLLNWSPINPFGATGHTAVVTGDGLATGTSADRIGTKSLDNVFTHRTTTYRRYTGN
jgi:RHS repeat-associated protein